MTSWPDTSVGAGRGWGTHLLLVGLILLGWAFALAQLLTIDSPGSLAGAGPGMQIFAHVKAYAFGDPFAFESALSFCVTGTGAWGMADVLKSAAMWLGMILAMMLPVLLPLGGNASRHRRPPSATFANLLGYVVAWLPFCAFGVAAQWALQRQGVLNAHHVLQHDGLSISILLFVALIHLSGLTTRGEIRTLATASAQSYRAGLRYGAHCLRCCGPLMIVMFVTGLMNIVAMLALTALMLATMSGNNRFLSITIGLSALLGAVVLGVT
jgi:predicted metal-binding membrane protein